MRPDEHDGQAFITPAIQEDAGLYTLVNWTYRMGVPDAIEKPETTFVNVIYRDGTEGHLLAKNVAWSQVHQFRIESKGEELGGVEVKGCPALCVGKNVHEELCGKTKAQNEKMHLKNVSMHFPKSVKDLGRYVDVHVPKLHPDLCKPLINFLGMEGALKEMQFDLHSGAILPDKQTIAEQFPHYFKDVSHLKVIDIYRVLDLWEVKDNAIGHAIKKLLVAGGRGAKDAEQDVREAMVSLQRWQEMQAENATDESSEG